MAQEFLVVMTTFAVVEDARRIARVLVEENLVACANLVPGVESIYRWEGAVQQEAEILVVMKTTTDRWERLQARMREVHPYKVPEIISMPVAAGLPEYEEWVRGAVS